MNKQHRFIEEHLILPTYTESWIQKLYYKNTENIAFSKLAIYDQNNLYPKTSVEIDNKLNLSQPQLD